MNGGQHGTAGPATHPPCRPRYPVVVTLVFLKSSTPLTPFALSNAIFPRY